MKWEEEQRRPSLAGVEGGGEGGSGATGAGATHHVAAGGASGGGEGLAAGSGEGISQAGGPGGAQQGGRPGFVGLSGKKLMPNEHDWRLPLCRIICIMTVMHVNSSTGPSCFVLADY